MNRTSLSEQAYWELRSAIIDQRLPQGASLVESELASMLGVSRTPVREALRRLELEGYLERDAAGRLLVHVLTPKELSDLFLVRELLEGKAARLAAARISDHELDRLEQLLAADEQALKRGNVEDRARLNEQIHDVVLEASRNAALRDMVRSLRGRVYGLSAFAVGSPEDQMRFVHEHRQLVALLREGDGEAAEELARRHLRTARDLLIVGLEPDAEGGASTGRDLPIGELDEAGRDLTQAPRRADAADHLRQK